MSVVTALSEREAVARLKQEGPNALPDPQRRSGLHIAAELLREPMFALLVGAAILYGVLGELTDALVLLCFACASVSIAVVQETRSERVLESLRDLTSSRASPIRWTWRCQHFATERGLLHARSCCGAIR